jgi:hypothetical protein
MYRSGHTSARLLSRFVITTDFPTPPLFVAALSYHSFRPSNPHLSGAPLLVWRMNDLRASLSGDVFASKRQSMFRLRS